MRSASAGRVRPSLSSTPRRSAASAALGRLAFDLDEIGLGQLEPRIGDARLQPAVVGQQQQPFAVAVQPAGGIDAGHIDEVRQRRARGLRCLVGELAEHAIGLVEQDQPGHNPVRLAPIFGRVKFSLPARRAISS